MRKLFSLRGITTSLVFSAIIFALVACEGASGAPGLPGNPGNPGAPGAQGPEGPAGAAAEGSASAGLVTSKSTMTMSEPFQVWGSGFEPGEAVMLKLAIDQSASPVVGGGVDDLLVFD